MILKYPLIIIFSFFLINSYANSNPNWGPTGHRTMAEVTNQHLSKKAKKNINKLLNGQSLVFVSTFADDIKSDKKYDKFKPWHYVNYPFDSTYKNSQKNPKGDVVMGIKKCISILKDKNTSKEEQVFYLKMLVHLVGDLHQPLHVGLADDKGGNDFQVRWFNKGTNLHRVWDSQMIESYNMSYTELSNNLFEYSKESIKQIQTGTPEQWADEVHLLAEKVYQSATIGEKLWYEYSYKHFSTVRKQLYISGLRLASILNDIYG
ncbi:MAG: S1/P1 nuclease [Bacteroidota bacterium]